MHPERVQGKLLRGINGFYVPTALYGRGDCLRCLMHSRAPSAARARQKFPRFVRVDPVSALDRNGIFSFRHTVVSTATHILAAHAILAQEKEIPHNAGVASNLFLKGHLMNDNCVPRILMVQFN